MQKTILIVEDEFTARKLLRMQLSHLPEYTIVGEAGNGQKGLELFHTLHPDIVITDIEMPIMNGLDMFQAIRAEAPRQPVIILSCYESFQYAQRAIQLRVHDYLVKDMVTVEELKACLDGIAVTSPIGSRLSAQMPYSPGDGLENLRGVPDSFVKAVEQDVERLSTSFFCHEKQQVLEEIRRLYKTHLTGMTQFCFLQRINHIVISWIVNECVRYQLSTEDILSGVGSPLSYLENINGADAACDLMCHWVGNLMDGVKETSRESVRIKSVVTYLNENYNKDLNLQSIADHFHIHKVYLSRSFKEETGVNLVAYLNYLRIEKAKLLLCLDTYKTNEIAYMVGFNNTQNFYNVFKRLMGCSPSDYVQKFRKDGKST